MSGATRVASLLNEATSYVKQYSKWFRNNEIGTRMDTVDMNANVALQLKTFQNAYKNIDKKHTKRIEKQTNPTIKADYIYRQKRDYTILQNKIQNWLKHYKNDVVSAIDIFINSRMLDRNNRPFRCKPPVCDYHNRYYFGRTVGFQKTLAIRSNCDGNFQIHGWLHYDSCSGATIEQFDTFIEYTETNVASFITELTIANDAPTASTRQPLSKNVDEKETRLSDKTESEETYQNEMISTAIVVYTDTDSATTDNCLAEEEISEEMKYQIVLYEQKNKHDNDDDDDDDDDYVDDDYVDDEMNEDEMNEPKINEKDMNSATVVDTIDTIASDIDEDATSKKTANTTTKNTTKNTTSFPPLSLTPSNTHDTQQGVYIDSLGLQNYLEEHFEHASLDIATLITSKYNRRTRLYTLKEKAYKKLATTPVDETALKTHSDKLRKLLLNLWKNKQFVYTSEEYVSKDTDEQRMFTFVNDGRM